MQIKLITSSVALAMVLSLAGCVSDYQVDPGTKEVTVVLPDKTKNSPEITGLQYSLREKYRHTQIGVIQLGDELRVIYPSDLLFGVGNTQLLAHSELYLDMLLGEVRRQNNLTYMIEGLTDSSGSQAGNVALSVKRAQSVADYLESHGLSADEMMVKGYGGLYSVADNETKQGRAKNRRIVITVLLKPQKSSVLSSLGSLLEAPTEDDKKQNS